MDRGWLAGGQEVGFHQQEKDSQGHRLIITFD